MIDEHNDYYKSLFNGKCPYTDKECLEKIPCIRCQANDEERAWMDEMEKMEMAESEE